MPSLLNQTLDMRINSIKFGMEQSSENIEDLKSGIAMYQARLTEVIAKNKDKLDLIAALEALKEPEPNARPVS